MRPVSDEFLRTVRGSHRMVVEVRVVAPGQTGVAPDGELLDVSAGDVQVDGTADVRSTVDLTVVGPRMWPTGAGDLLAPYGNELHIRRGIRYGSGSTEWVSLGYHRVDAVAQDSPPDGPVRVTASDRMAGIVDARLTAPTQYRAGLTLGGVLEGLVREVYPAAAIEWDDGTNAATLGRAVIAEEDRFAFLNDLVRAAGKTWYWDHRGVLVIRSPPPASSPVYDVSAGEDGVLVSLARTLSREGVYNAVVATGEGADTVAPARALAVDDNPLSPTYWSGPFGKVPRFYSSPFITTTAAARSAAAAMLTRSLGLPYSVDFSLVPNPALEPFDPVRVVYPGGRSEVHVIESLTVPLVAAGVMSASTREQTLVALGVS